ncbi:uncharacterized protein V6R79_019661 [Siganus canaliculatus]
MHWLNVRVCTEILFVHLGHDGGTWAAVVAPGSSDFCKNIISSDESSMSPGVSFSCGDVVCPSGMDCLEDAGIQSCADPCQNYTVLNDDWRSTINTVKVFHCDDSFTGQEWYRLLLNNTNARIPEYCVDQFRCGTQAPMFLTTPHPTAPGEIVERSVCNHWDGDCCYFDSVNIHVKLCHGDFYVYKLVQPPICNLAYCAGPTTAPASPQAFNLICGRDQIQIGVNVAEMKYFQLDPWSGNLANYYCSNHTESDGIVWYEVAKARGACGNLLTTNDTHSVYSNSLFIYPNSSSSSLPVDIPFSCAYPLDTDASLNVALRPLLDLDAPLSGSGAKARAFMYLYRDSSYAQTYPPGIVVLPVGSPLYVGVTVEDREPRFAAVLEDCYATYTANPEDPVAYHLIQNQCPADSKLVSVTQSGSSLQARFTALFMLLSDDEFRDVYFHCSLSLCDHASSSCVPSCSSRTRRSASSSELLEPVTIGPITWSKTP